MCYFDCQHISGKKKINSQLLHYNDFNTVDVSLDINAQ